MSQNSTHRQTSHKFVKYEVKETGTLPLLLHTGRIEYPYSIINLCVSIRFLKHVRLHDHVFTFRSDSQKEGQNDLEYR